MAELFVPGWVLRQGAPVLHGAMGTVTFVHAAGDSSVRAVVKHPKAEYFRRADPGMQEQIIDRFLAEQAFVAACCVPNVPVVYGTGTAVFPDVPDRPLPYVVLEELSPVSLADAPVAMQLRFLVGTLQAAHRFTRITAKAPDGSALRGILHRDIKVENVWMCGEDRVVFMDFGLACWIDGARGTALGERVGTPDMMAPELLQSGRDIGPNADLFSIGAMCVKLLTGAPPFPGRTADEVLARMRTTPLDAVLHAVRSAPLLSELVERDAFLSVLRRLLEKEPGLRFRRPWDALVALAAIPEVCARVQPLAFPWNPRAFEAETLREQLSLLTAAEPSALLETCLAAHVRGTTPEAALASLWDSGAIRPGDASVEAAWERILPDASFLLALGGPCSAYASFLHAVDACVRRGEDFGGSLPELDPQQMAEFLQAYTAAARVPLERFPQLRLLLAHALDRAGRFADAERMLAGDERASARTLRCSIALRLGRKEEAATLLAGLPVTGASATLAADLAIARGDVKGVLDATAPEKLPSDTSDPELLNLDARRLRVLRVLLKRLGSTPDSYEAQGYAAEKEKVLSRVTTRASAFAELPVDLAIALGILSADDGAVDAAEQHFASALRRLPNEDVVSRHIAAENLYIARKERWEKDPRESAQKLAELVRIASDAVALAERCGDPLRIKNALINFNEILAIELTHALVPSLRTNDPALGDAIARFEATREIIQRNELRIDLLLDGAPDPHELSRRLAPWKARLAVLFTELVRFERWYADADEAYREKKSSFIPAADDVATVSLLRDGLTQLLLSGTVASAGTATVAELVQQARRCIHDAPDVSHALRAVLDWAIAHYGARSGVIYFSERLGSTEPPPYRFGRRHEVTVLKDGTTERDITDLPEAPVMSQTLKKLFLASPQGDIVSSTSPAIIGTESVMLMGADLFLGAALGNRGALILVVDTLKDRSFGDADKRLLVELAGAITKELTQLDLETELRTDAARLAQRAFAFQDLIHSTKNAYGPLQTKLGFIRDQFQETFAVTPANEGDYDQGVYLHYLDATNRLLKQIDVLERELEASKRGLSEELDQLKGSNRKLGYQAPSGAHPAERIFGFFRDDDASAAEHAPAADLVAFWRDLWATLPASGDVAFSLDSADALPAVVFDRGAVAHIFGNLRSNLLHPDVYRGTQRPPHASARIHLLDGRFCIEVSDNGRGMDQELLDLVVQEGGCTTKPVGEGTGVGIPSIILAMQRHWGGVEFFSTPGAGTRIRLLFPLGPPKGRY